MPTDPALLAEVDDLKRLFERHRSFRSLHDDPAWSTAATRLMHVLDGVRWHQPSTPPPPRPHTHLRAVQWNIEHGNWLDRVRAALLEHPSLAGADLLFFNEIDLGCARSRNLDVAGELARALGFHGVWLPYFIELTIGRDDDPATAGGRTNEESIVGIAILSRWPITAAHVVPLPGPEELHFRYERMVGRYAGLVAEVDRPGAPFVAVSTHLEVHRTRAHRAAQMRDLLEALAGETRPIVLAGDFNTHTFDRGLWHTPFLGAVTLLMQPGGSLRERLLRPDRGRWKEPLFDALGDAGFAWEPFVDFAPTLSLRMHRLVEADPVLRLFGPLGSAMRRHAEARGHLRLDWFAGRGWNEGRGETVHGLDGPGLASDHAPIVASFR